MKRRIFGRCTGVKRLADRTAAGWIRLFFALPLPMLTPEGSSFGRSFGEWHQTMEWALLIVIGIHVAAALAHIFIYRDRIMLRMLP
jgi:cytochrome b561